MALLRTAILNLVQDRPDDLDALLTAYRNAATADLAYLLLCWICEVRDDRIFGFLRAELSDRSKPERFRHSALVGLQSLFNLGPRDQMSWSHLAAELFGILRDRSESERLRASALSALSNSADPLPVAEMEPLLMELFQSRPGPTMLSTLVTAVGRLPQLAQHVPRLRDLLLDHNTDHQVLLPITDVLANLQDSAATNTLLELLHDPRPSARKSAARSLGVQTEKENVTRELVHTAASDPSPDVRIAAIEALTEPIVIPLVASNRELPGLLQQIAEDRTNSLALRVQAAKGLVAICSAPGISLVESAARVLRGLAQSEPRVKAWRELLDRLGIQAE